MSELKYVCALACAGLVGLAAFSASADTEPAEANPYSVISDRNIFHLNPPPPPPAPPEAKPVDLPKVMLTGIVGKGKSIKAYLAVPNKDSKKGMEFLTLKPGEKQDDVELVKIDQDKREVDILNSGTAQTLSAKSNSYVASASAPASPPGRGGGPPAMPAMPGFRRNNIPGGGAPGQPPPSSAVGSSIGGSTVIAGGGGGSFGSSSGGGNAIVSGGGGGNALVSGGYSPTAQPVAANNNNVGAQIANTLFNPQTGHYEMPQPTAPPAPPDVQAATLLLHEAAGGPPSPVHFEEGGGPPGPPGVP